MDKGSKLLSELLLARTYAATKENGTKETWEEVVERNKSMHIRKFPHLTQEIEAAYEKVYKMRVLPSMRSLQFSGPAIENNQLRMFNCSAIALSNFKAFADLAFLSMSGTGVGYSVCAESIEQLPIISKGVVYSPYSIPDTKEGWADSFELLLKNPNLQFDYAEIRAEGTPLSSGGTASGPGVLQAAHEAIRALLMGAVGRKLKAIEAHDIACHIADCVVSGGVRRSALIAIFDPQDEEMLACKQGNWWEKNGQRARANNSARILRFWTEEEQKKAYDKVMDACFASNSGEPGIFFSNDTTYFTNPCAEISLRINGLCNLTEINLSALNTPEEFYEACKAAAFIGTLQAAYTDFTYVHSDFKKNADEEALLGVSLTGICATKLEIEPNLLSVGAEVCVKENKRVAKLLGIRPSSRITTVKPSGSASMLLGTTSGIHAAHSPHYLRRVRVDASGALGQHLASTFGVMPPDSGFLVEKDAFSNNLVVCVPVKMDTAVVREQENDVSQLERMKLVKTYWVDNGHIKGPNTHNVSITVSYKKDEEESVKEWMWNNREVYSGISLLPYDGGSYTQAPFTTITEEQYNEAMLSIPESLQLDKVKYNGEADQRNGESSCSAGGCEVV